MANGMRFAVKSTRLVHSGHINSAAMTISNTAVRTSNVPSATSVSRDGGGGACGGGVAI